MDHSNSISPGSGMQPRDAQHPPPLHSTECTHTHGGRGGGEFDRVGKENVGSSDGFSTKRLPIRHLIRWPAPSPP